MGYRDSPYRKAEGLILNENYEKTETLAISDDISDFNMHEFTVSGMRPSAIHATTTMKFHNHSDITRPEVELWINYGGFREIDVRSGETIFEWSCLDHIELHESYVPWLTKNATTQTWDYVHLNSIDKNEDGDYLVSARFTDTIYKVSGKNGSIIWRLGGKRSDFTTDFQFSRQHHARWLESNETHATISLLNNAADPDSQIADYSSGFIVALHTEQALRMRATLTAQYIRPDRQITNMRGSIQVLNDGNSEFTASGDCVMDASFTTDRFNTYRAYKYNFTGSQVEPPTIKSLAYGVQPSTTVTVVYLSWDGATEVRSWNFYNNMTSSSHSSFVGNTPKLGFESMFIYNGYIESVWAEALDADGRVLRVSGVEQTILSTNYVPSSSITPGNNFGINDSKLLGVPLSTNGLSFFLLMLALSSAAVLVVFFARRSGKVFCKNKSLPNILQ
ncbi:hypothetical protein N7490_010808 [Penicillium lividum]|nr:hypothetical protein N7490_010808 [Penicillium lividum]